MDKLLELKKMIQDSSIDDEFKEKAIQIVDKAISRGNIDAGELSQLKEIMSLGEDINDFLESEYLKAADDMASYSGQVGRVYDQTQGDIQDAVSEGQVKLDNLVQE